MTDEQRLEQLHSQIAGGIEKGAVQQARDAFDALKGARAGGVNQGNLNYYLSLAAETGQPDLVRLFIGAGGDVNNRDRDHHGVTVLHLAAGFYSPCAEYDPRKAQHRDCVRLLLDAGATLPVRDCYGNTPLHTAVRHSDTGMAQLLLERGDEPGAENSNGKTPLNAAAFNGDMAMAKLLLEHGADVNYNSACDGSTALHRAVRLDNPDMVTALLDNNAEIDSQAKNGNTPLLDAVEHRQNGMAELLIGLGGPAGRPALRALGTLYGPGYDRLTTAGRRRLFKRLLDHGVPLDRPVIDATGETLLHVMCANGKVSNEDIQLLLDHNREIINARDGQGRTPLHACLSRENKRTIYRSTIELLLEAGAEPNLADADGMTALGLAQARNLPKKHRNLLLDHGAETREQTPNLPAALPAAMT